MIISLLIPLCHTVQEEENNTWMVKKSIKDGKSRSFSKLESTYIKKIIWNGVGHKIKNKASNYRSQWSTNNCNATKYHVCIALHYSPHGTLFQMLLTSFIEMSNEPLIWFPFKPGIKRGIVSKVTKKDITINQTCFINSCTATNK